MFYNLFTPTHLILMPALLGLYLLPTFISMRQRHPGHVFVAILNIFFGSTGIGWLVALLWALNPQIVLVRQPPVEQR